MKVSPKNSPNPVADPSPTRWITHAAFVIALAVVIARLTTPDALRDPWEVSPGSPAMPASPGPATSLVFDLLACIPALLILARRAIDRSYRLARQWSHPLLFALAIWSLLSTAWSADRFAAAVTSAHFFAAACLLWAMSQLVRSTVHFRLVSALAFGLLLVLVVQSALYKYMDVPANISYWNEKKDEILKEHNWPPDSFAAKQFEHKLVSGELVGFFNSANTFAAGGVLLFFACVGIGIQKWRDRESQKWLILPVIAVLSLVWILINARSKTAAATPVLGIVSLGMFILWRHRLAQTFQSANLKIVTADAPIAPGRKRPTPIDYRSPEVEMAPMETLISSDQHRRAFWVALALVAFAMIAIVGHGLYHHGLFPGHFSNSLDFRWKYWVASAGIFVNHPVMGVGWNNFGLYYLAHRLPEAAEEIKDPHNFLVRFFVELGIVGGTLSVAWLLRAAWEITRPGADGPAKISDDPISIKSAALIVVIGMLLSIAANVDFTQSAGNVVALLLKPLLYLLTLLFGTIAAAMLSQHSWSLDDRPAPWIFYFTVTGLGLFLLHNLIDFSWFETGAMFLFMALLGSAHGLAPVDDGRSAPKSIAIAVAVACAFAWLGAAIFFVAPVLLAEQSAADAGELIRTATDRNSSALVAKFRQAADDLATASHLVPFNSDYVYRHAEICLRIGDMDQAKALIVQTKQIDPMQPDAYLLDANVQLTLPNPDRAAVQSDFATIAALDPNNVTLHIQFGNALERFGLVVEAREQYKLALNADNALPIGEPKRLTAGQVEQLRMKLAGTDPIH